MENPARLFLLTLFHETEMNITVKRNFGPGRPTEDSEKAALRFAICLTPSRKAAYQKAARDLPVHLWAKRLLDAAANYKP
jgi:hypothetical protein